GRGPHRVGRPQPGHGGAGRGADGDRRRAGRARVTGPQLRRPAAADEAALLALNNAHAVELSLLSVERLRQLLAAAFHARVAADGTALLIAFDQGADYDSPNFRWFQARHQRF